MRFEPIIGGKMDEYVCISCGWIYDLEEGDPTSDIEPGTPFAEISEDWLCPNCSDGKDSFELVVE